MLTALLFDLDGTLANTDPLHLRTWQEILGQYGITVDAVFYKKHISGRLNPDIVRDLLPQLSLEEGLRLADRKEARFRELGTELQPLPGLLELLDWASQHQLSRALVTNAPRENAHFMLGVLGLEYAFTTVVLAEEATAGKPDPAPYQLALSRLGIMPGQALAFEDSQAGIRAAVAADIATVGIASTHEPQVLQKAGAMQVIPDFTDPKLVEIFAALGLEITAGTNSL
ncbi:HAD family phosphatase [Leptolyngbya sp. FACHB-261]|uniref:HAD family hydrolase n=1 Tax=Leptolyngbya sp. FACHB-261 TaxID=2692806 RepID=UPI00168486FD|nr:HAD family phosphatase [Leptolyngbya sp. FACHB-261]MBD2102737.1 HAD family phosphatase [Leptolyngbya sp. FACHB-261]